MHNYAAYIIKYVELGYIHHRPRRQSYCKYYDRLWIMMFRSCQLAGKKMKTQNHGGVG